MHWNQGITENKTMMREKKASHHTLVQQHIEQHL